MRAIWVDAGNDADWTKAQKHKLTALFYPVTDPVADVRRRIAETKQHGYLREITVAGNNVVSLGRDTA